MADISARRSVAPVATGPRGDVAVAVVGAGLSGLVAARALEWAGVTDLVVLEARDRVGGRLLGLSRSTGPELQLGGEFTGPGQPRLQALARNLGIGVQTLPGLQPDAALSDVRLWRGERYVERELLGGDPEAAGAHARAVAALDGLAAELPLEDPWSAPGAAELDARTFAGWLAEHVPSEAARDSLANAFVPLGGSAVELSLLYLLWVIRAAGSFAECEEEVSARFVPGSAEIVRRLAAGLGCPVQLATPVRSVARDAEGVELRTDRGTVRARAAVMAMAPTQCAKVEFTPPLPPLRDRAQSRWLQGHGGKVFAVYDSPWWRDQGLSGFASGDDLLPFALDVSRDDCAEGVICGLICSTSDNVAANDAALAGGEAFRAAALDALAAYFGPRAREPRELHFKIWSGDRWSDGCGTGLPPGVLSAVGPALREPTGRIVWAGAETGLHEHMEGAVEAGERAAAEALTLL